MPVKKSGRTLQREEGITTKIFDIDTGLARTDNNLQLHSWPVIAPINQKNYYTDYLKRDDQSLVYRQQGAQEKAAREQKERQNAVAIGDDDGTSFRNINGDIIDTEGENSEQMGLLGSKILVIHPGSRNLRIGLASDALPKTIPNVIARRLSHAEFEEDDGGPRPKRFKVDMEDVDMREDTPEEEGMTYRRTRGAAKRATSLEKEPLPATSTFEQTFKTLSEQLKIQMRQNKRRILPNSRESAVAYNKRMTPETIKDHNDPNRAEWTDVSGSPEFIVGSEALKIQDTTKPRYKLFWPMRDGVINEHDYQSKRTWLEDVSTILGNVIENELNIDKKDLKTYWACLVIPDLYDKVYVTEMLEMLLRDFQFSQVCIFQESMATSFGAGFSSACIVDIGAQKTSVSCVDEGMIVPDSRINLKYGGDDITNTLTQMFLYNSFPYDDIDLRRRYDYLLAEELKTKYATLNEADVAVQTYNFHVRAPNKETNKFNFKTYDEVYLAPMAYFEPSIIDVSDKLKGRRSLWPKSHDLYDDIPNDPTSIAQTALFSDVSNIDDTELSGLDVTIPPTTLAVPNVVPKGSGLNPITHPNNINSEGTPRTSTAGSPGPEASTPLLGASTPLPGVNGINFLSSISLNDVAEKQDDSILPIAPLDKAIFESIKHAAKGDEKKSKDYFTGVLVVGGGSLTPGFYHLLEQRLMVLKPTLSNIIISVPPRELDPQVIVWKGASVFGKLTGTNDTWIRQQEYDILGSRVLAYKPMFQW